MSEHEKASGKESPRWQRIAAAPSGFELWLLGIWIGTYLIVGSNSTIPSPVDAVVSRSLLNVLALSWEFVPGVFLLALLIRVALIAGFDLRGEAQIAFDRWISAAVIGMFVAVLVGTNFDLMARVRLSEAALLDEVKTINRWPAEDEAHLRDRAGWAVHGLQLAEEGFHRLDDHRFVRTSVFRRSRIQPQWRAAQVR